MANLQRAEDHARAAPLSTTTNNNDKDDWRKEKYEAALDAIKTGITGMERDKVLRALATSLDTPNAKSSTLKAIEAVLSQIVEPTRFKSDEQAWKAHGATERNFRRWKTNIKNIRFQGKGTEKMAAQMSHGTAQVDSTEQAPGTLPEELWSRCWESHTSSAELADLLPDTLDADPDADPDPVPALDGQHELGHVPLGPLSPELGGRLSPVDALEPVETIETAFAIVAIDGVITSEPTGGASSDASGGDMSGGASSDSSSGASSNASGGDVSEETLDEQSPDEQSPRVVSSHSASTNDSSATTSQSEPNGSSTTSQSEPNGSITTSQSEPNGSITTSQSEPNGSITTSQSEPNGSITSPAASAATAAAPPSLASPPANAAPWANARGSEARNRPPANAAPWANARGGEARNRPPANAAPCARPGCRCVSFDGEPGNYCCHTCRGTPTRPGKACMHRHGPDFIVHPVPTSQPRRSQGELPDGTFARCAHPECRCTASFDGNPGEHCCLTCKNGIPCQGNWHPTPQRRARKGGRPSF